MNTRADFNVPETAARTGLVPSIASSRIKSVPTRGTGLSAELFLPGTEISTLDMAATASRGIPDMCFVASRITHGAWRRETRLAEMRSPDASVTAGADNALACGPSVLTLSGFIFIPAGMHEIEVVCDGGVRLELGGTEFLQTDTSKAVNSATHVAEFLGGLYQIDLLCFDPVGEVSIGLRIDGLPVDQSALYQSKTDFQTPPEGTPLIPVTAYHPSFFLGEPRHAATNAWFGEPMAEFGDDDMILGLVDDTELDVSGEHVLAERAGTQRQDVAERLRKALRAPADEEQTGPRLGDNQSQAQVQLERAAHTEARPLRSTTRIDITRAPAPGITMTAGQMLQWFSAANNAPIYVISNTMRASVVRGPVLHKVSNAHVAARVRDDTSTSVADSDTSDAHLHPTSAEKTGDGNQERERGPVICNSLDRCGHPWLQSGAVALASSLMGNMEPPVVLLAHSGGRFGGSDLPGRVKHDPMHATQEGTLAFTFIAHSPGNDQTQALFAKVEAEDPKRGHLTAYIRGDGVLTIRFQGEDDQTHLLDSGVKIDPNERYHVAFAFEEDEVNLYLNGDLVDSDMGFAGGMLDNDQDVVLGASPCGGSGVGSGMRWHFSGVMENVMLLDRSITDVEAVFLAQAGGDITGIDALYGLGEDEVDHATEAEDITNATATTQDPQVASRPISVDPAALQMCRRLKDRRRKGSRTRLPKRKKATRPLHLRQTRAPTGHTARKSRGLTATSRSCRPVKATTSQRSRKAARAAPVFVADPCHGKTACRRVRDHRRKPTGRRTRR
jgi:hypothetical protein